MTIASNLENMLDKLEETRKETFKGQISSDDQIKIIECEKVLLNLQKIEIMKDIERMSEEV